MIPAHDILLTAEESRVRGRKHRNLVAIVVVVVIVVDAIFFGARPAAHAIKAWQARRHAHRAFTYIQNEQWNDAQREASAAYQLVPTEPEALRAVARFLSRIHQSEALDFWKQLEERQSPTRDDLRDEIAVALSAEDLSVAQSALDDLLARKDSPPSATDWLLAAQVAQHNGETAKARAFAKKILDDSRADERDQFQAALLLLALSSTDKTEADSIEAGWARLRKLAEGKSKTALAALVILAQRALSDTPSTIAALTRALETHPLAKTSHKLLALNLQIHADPTRREALISRAIADWKNGDMASLVALATWLDGIGEYQRQLDTIPLERALQSHDLFLLHLDALGALERWSEIKQLLESEHFPLDEVAQFMYLARCSERLGEKTASANNWQRALEATQGDSPKLMALAEYAEKNGANEIAEVAYGSATNASPKLRAAWQGRVRIAQASGDTKKMHDLFIGMLRMWPNDNAIQNDEAYTRLLLLGRNQDAKDEGQETADRKENAELQTLSREDSSILNPQFSTLNEIAQLAERLVEQNPHSLPHRTLLALARLRENRPREALGAYANIQFTPNAMTPSALAVHAAVLAANGRADDAKTEAGQIKVDNLLPEEKALIQNL